MADKEVWDEREVDGGGKEEEEKDRAVNEWHCLPGHASSAALSFSYPLAQPQHTASARGTARRSLADLGGISVRIVHAKKSFMIIVSLSFFFPTSLSTV